MKALWWWLRECWWSFPLKPRRKSHIGDGKFGAYMPPDLYETFKDVGKQYPLHPDICEFPEDDDTKEG